VIGKIKLKRSLGLPLVALYGLGNILGAGIYVLVGKVAGIAGENTVLAFMVAMVIAGLTAFSYMELSGRYPLSASVSVYLYEAFKKRWLSVAVGVALVLGGITSAAALAQGFAGYLAAFVPIPIILGSVGILLAMGLVAIKGMKESAWLAAVFTILEVIGLLLVVWTGRHAFGEVDVAGLLTISPAIGVSGLMAGAFLAFYAFIGFEDMVNVAEEVKNPRLVMPRAIFLALLGATVLYVLVAMVATVLVSPTELAASSAPLVLVSQKAGADIALVLGVIGMVATINGMIVQLIMGSRILYGLAAQGWLPSWLATVHRGFRTPMLATIVVLVSMVFGTILLSLVSLAQLTSLLLLSIFILVHISLIVIKRRHKKHTGYFTVPIWVPWAGVVVSAITIGYQLVSWLSS